MRCSILCWFLGRVSMVFWMWCSMMCVLRLGVGLVGSVLGMLKILIWVFCVFCCWVWLIYVLCMMWNSYGLICEVVLKLVVLVMVCLMVICIRLLVRFLCCDKDSVKWWRLGRRVIRVWLKVVFMKFLKFGYYVLFGE